MDCPPEQKNVAGVERWPFGGGSTAYNNFRSADTKKM